MANSKTRNISFSNNSKNYMTLILDMFDKYNLPISEDKNYIIPIYLASASRLFKSIKDNTKGTAGRIPALSLEFLKYELASARGTNRLNKRSIVQLEDGENIRVWRTGVAVDFSFRLTLLTKNMHDLTNISEDIIAEFHNNVRYLYYNNMFNESVSVAMRLNSVDNESDTMQDEFFSLGLNSMVFDLTVEGNVDINKPYDSRKITSINLMLEQQLQNTELLLDKYTVLPE